MTTEKRNQVESVLVAVSINELPINLAFASCGAQQKIPKLTWKSCATSNSSTYATAKFKQNCTFFKFFTQLMPIL